MVGLPSGHGGVWLMARRGGIEKSRLMRATQRRCTGGYEDDGDTGIGSPRMSPVPAARARM